jgi:hypothetical protein
MAVLSDHFFLRITGYTFSRSVEEKNVAVGVVSDDPLHEIVEDVFQILLVSYDVFQFDQIHRISIDSVVSTSSSIFRVPCGFR